MTTEQKYWEQNGNGGEIPEFWKEETLWMQRNDMEENWGGALECALESKGKENLRWIHGGQWYKMAI